MPDSDPLGCFSSMPNGPFLSSPHKTENLTGEPGCISSHLRSAAGTVISCLPFAKLIYLISSSIDLANDKDKLPGPPARSSCRAKPGWRPGQLHPLVRERRAFQSVRRARQIRTAIGPILLAAGEIKGVRTL